mmetsp:Transcript_7616/g.18661  ORF Transcript_7616/g.18661 Transcript_7616/m.18661 type:complete len:260 (-) Transcript_7616:392-1171(-)|eukprot:CAMPEP_0116096756 /NCGR_PEP_ID=MMETSP0327-20121206/10348_1 /TAXON_ID=44447 /ORGANISM="Pseudo-nitzschia delicatissima, Strain B596" /LENGTH=259 /DNA_ID=CAMNT_0003588475 /DNA_START=41 /DNA_END=820 /DNA_ORIENTATION=+
MPPYVDHSNNHSDHDLSGICTDFVHVDEDVDVFQDEKKKSIVAKMLCPCTVKVGNPSSALFKIRTCAECGEQVHKYSGGGYEKEEYDDSTKVYFHKSCLQTREDRTIHKQYGFGLVLIDLLDYFPAKAQKKRMEEECAARKVEEEAKEARALAQAFLEAEEKNKGFAKRFKRSLKVFSKKSKNAKVSNNVNHVATKADKNINVATDDMEPTEIWKTAIDPKSGRTYYYHTATRETTWNKPSARRLYEAEHKKWVESRSV